MGPGIVLPPIPEFTRGGCAHLRQSLQNDWRASDMNISSTRAHPFSWLCRKPGGHLCWVTLKPIGPIRSWGNSFRLDNCPDRGSHRQDGAIPIFDQIHLSHSGRTLPTAWKHMSYDAIDHPKWFRTLPDQTSERNLHSERQQEMGVSLITVWVLGFRVECFGFWV